MQMSITVRELMQLPHLQMSLLAGQAGLDREVTWVHTSDLPDPWQWHGWGELLLTNGTALAPEGAAQAHFAEQVAESGASGLAIGLGMPGPPLTATVTQRADELALPLLTVPFSVPFTAVVRAVADANDREEASQLRHVARLYELLRLSMASGRHGPDMFRRIGNELGVRLYLVDPATGRSLFDDQAESAYAPVLAASYAARGNAIPGMLRLRLQAAEPAEACAFAVAVPGDAPTALLVEALGDQLPSPVLLQHIAVGGALELAQLTAGQERQRRVGADLLTRILDRRIYPAAAGSQLAEFGLDLATSVLVVSNSADDRAVADLDRRLARARVPHILLDRDQLLYLVLADSDVNAKLVTILRSLSSSVGVSDVVRTADRMVAAVQEARWALGASQAENRDLIRYGDQTVLLLPRTTAEATVLVSRVLGPLIRHDAERGTQYLTTLRVMLRLDRSWQLAAAELHIHKQTLGYRVRRIEQITGRGLTKTEHIAELWIALQSHDLLADHVVTITPSCAVAGSGPGQ
jgi:PucR family transcriptional regulator, purine catabolism regulatory protein